MKLNTSDIYLSKEKEFTDLINNIIEEKPLENYIQEVFMDKNNIFGHDDIADEDKKFIIDLIDRTDFSFDEKIYNDFDDAKMGVDKEEVKERLEPEIKDKVVEEEKILDDSIVPKNELHTEKEKLRNETEGDTFLLKRARKIKE